MGYIKETCKDKIFDSANIVEVIGDFVELKKSGSNYKGFSPFVKENTPSFMVSPVKEIFKDYASGKGGNVISFLIEKGMSYPEALEYIAKKYSITVEYEALEFSEKKVKQLEEKDKLRKVLSLVLDLYKDQYKNAAADHPCKLEIVGKRQYNEEKILDWGIGFAPDNFIYDKLKASGYLKEGEALGLIHISENGNRFDKYSNRVIYPIHDRNGLLIGLAGRDVSNKSRQGKWINPPVNPDNIIYNKSRVWYGLHKAKMAMRKNGEVFITEGYNDVIAWHENGLENTVASCGTAITDEQIIELKKYCEKVIFCMDPDRAGIEAVLKHIPRFIRAGFRVEVITLDLDPDDFVRQYSDIIGLCGGLQVMLNTPGIRQDGFQLLVNEFIKKDYYHFEIKLKEEKINLAHYEQNYALGRDTLNEERNVIEGDLLQAKNLLKEIELTVGKKEEAYKDQLKTTSLLSGQLEAKKHTIKNYVEPVELKQQRKIVEGLKNDLDSAFKNSESNRASGAKKLCSDIIHVADNAYFEIYLNWIQDESKISKSTLNSWIKELKSKEIDEEDDEYDEYTYELPKGIKTPLSDLLPVIKVYGMFMANNQIFMALPETRGKVFFSSISNFEIEILQHMNDEKFPKKLIRIKNIHNKETIFDTPSESINTPQSFNTVVTNHGNYRFKGNNADLNLLLTYLFDHMGDGKKIDALGWQHHAKVWVWNNKVIDDSGNDIPLDENGRFIHAGVHYYVPSANRIYATNASRYSSQKKFIVIENSVSFEMYLQKVYQVHRDHAIQGILFAIASLFQDIIAAETKSFPILFLYGPGSSGKDGLARVVQSFTGIPQSPISLESGASTAKASIREFAQFINSFGHLSEYFRGDGKLDGTLKGFWDRNGYKLANFESKISSEAVEIESSVILTGNQYPDKEALITRLLWNEMTKYLFSEEEMKEYDELEDMTDAGVSGYANSLLGFRKIFKENFSKKYRLWKGYLQENFKDAKGRIIGNYAVLGATYEIFRDCTEAVRFPFSKDELLKNVGKEIAHQMAKMNSGSIMLRFWNCFIIGLRGNANDRIQSGHIVNVEANTLFFNWTHVYGYINKQWYLQYREGCPVLATFKEEFKKTGLIVEERTKHSFDHGREANRTSAVGINLLLLPEETREDIIGYIMFQKSENTFFPTPDPKDKWQEVLPLATDSLELEPEDPF